MTDRAKRLQRLVALRTLQHDAAVAHLQAARASQNAANLAMEQSQQSARDAHAAMHVELDNGDQPQWNPHGWLLACADVELSKVVIKHSLQQQVAASAVVQAAAETEVLARRDRKQLETTLQRVKEAHAIEAARAEQSFLDETARLISGASQRQMHTRRDH